MALQDEITSDLAEIFSTTDLASSCTYRFDGTGAGATISVVYVGEFDAAMLHGVGLEGSKPFALARASDVSDATRDSTLTIGDNTWRVIGVHPHTAFMTKLMLSHDAELSAIQILTPAQLAALSQVYLTDSLSYAQTEGYLRCIWTNYGVPFGLAPEWAILLEPSNALRHEGGDLTAWGWFLAFPTVYGSLIARTFDGAVDWRMYYIGGLAGYVSVEDAAAGEYVACTVPAPLENQWHCFMLRYKASTKTLDISIDNTTTPPGGGSVSSRALTNPLADNANARTLFGSSNVDTLNEFFAGGLRNIGVAKGSWLTDDERTAIYNNGFSPTPLANIAAATRSKITSFWHFSGADYAPPPYLDSVGSAHLYNNSGNVDDYAIQLSGAQSPSVGTAAYLWMPVSGGATLNANPSEPNNWPVIRTGGAVDVRDDRYLFFQPEESTEPTSGLAQASSGYVWAIVKVPGAPEVGDAKYIVHANDPVTGLTCLIFENKPMLSVGNDTFGASVNIELTPGTFHLVEWGWTLQRSWTRIDGANYVTEPFWASGSGPNAALLDSWRMVGTSDPSSVSGFSFSDLCIAGAIREPDRRSIQATLLARVEELNA